MELYSCSGRLSWYAVSAELCTGFPVDFRYGWDMRNKAHRAMVDEATDFFNPDVVSSAPACRLWSAAKRKVNAAREAIERQLEMPALEWLVGRLRKQVARGRHFIVENPWRGEIFKITPLSKVTKIEGNVMHRVDQCQERFILLTSFR